MINNLSFQRVKATIYRMIFNAKFLALSLKGDESWFHWFLILLLFLPLVINKIYKVKLNVKENIFKNPLQFCNCMGCPTVDEYRD